MVGSDDVTSTGGEKIRRVRVPVVSLVSDTDCVPEQLGTVANGAVLAVFEVKVEAVTI